MAHEPRPAPQVTVTDPARPLRPPDVLESEPRQVGRRTLLRLAAAVAALGLLAAALEVRGRRATAAEQRRLDGVVQLAATAEGGSSGYQDGVARLDNVLKVDNDGPRDVEVVAATIGPFTLDAEGVRVPAGSFARLSVSALVPCTSRPVPDDVLVLDVRTAAGPRTVRLPLQLAVPSEEVDRTCGVVPVAQSVFLSVSGASRPGDSLVLGVEIGVQSARPVEVLEVVPGAGLRARLQRPDGGPLPLPLRLSSDPGTVDSSAYGLRMEVADCDAARAGAGMPTLALRVRGATGDEATVETFYELGYLLDLLLDVC